MIVRFEFNEFNTYYTYEGKENKIVTCDAVSQVP